MIGKGTALADLHLPVRINGDETVAPELRVDPHHWADAARGSGWVLQLQPGLFQANGTALPPTTHLTITPVTEGTLAELVPALVAAADAVRGVPHVDAGQLLAALPPAEALGALDSDTAWALLQGFGIGGSGGLPDQQAPLIALIEALPAPLAERLLTELIARLAEPDYRWLRSRRRRRLETPQAPTFCGFRDATRCARRSSTSDVRCAVPKRRGGNDPPAPGRAWRAPRRVR